MNTTIKNIVAFFILVSCALNVSCHKDKNLHSAVKTFKIGPLHYSENRYAKIYTSSNKFNIEIEGYFQESEAWILELAPYDVYCTSCSMFKLGKSSTLYNSTPDSEPKRKTFFKFEIDEMARKNYEKRTLVFSLKNPRNYIDSAYMTLLIIDVVY